MVNPLKVEFQFDFGSPNAYLAELALPADENLPRWEMDLHWLRRMGLSGSLTSRWIGRMASVHGKR